MSEDLQLIVIYGSALLLIYGLIIWVSIRKKQGIAPYIVCLALNIITFLIFLNIISQPVNDPQGGMGLGLLLIVFGIFYVSFPIIALIIFIVRQLRRKKI